MTVYMRQLGLSPSECAIIYGINPFLAALVRPLYGLIADKLHQHRLVLMLCIILCGITMGCLLLVPSVAVETNINQSGNTTFICGQNGSHLEICNKDENFLCRLGFISMQDTQNDDGTEPRKCNVLCETATESLCIHSRRDDEHTCMISTGNDSFIISSPAFGNNLTHASLESSCMDLSVNDIVYKNITVEESFCDTDTRVYCFINCTNNDIDACELSKGGNFQKRNFWIFAGVFFLAQILFSPICSLIDALTYSHLGDERGKWGNQRVWGTIGFALFGVTSGFVMDAVSEKKADIDYTWSFVLFILHSLLAAAAIYRYRTGSDVRCSKAMQKLRQLLSMPEVLALLILLFAFGMFTGVIETFLFWHLQNLGGPQLLLGLCMVMSCLPEIFIMFILGWIIERFGEILCLYSVCFAYVARFLGYSFLKEPWLVLLIEPLHGFTYGIMFGAATSYGSRLTPEGMHGTVQAIITSMHFGFGKSIHYHIPDTGDSCRIHNRHTAAHLQQFKVHVER